MKIDFNKEPWRHQLSEMYKEKPTEELLKSKRESVLKVLAENLIGVEQLAKKNVLAVDRILVRKHQCLDYYRFHENSNIRMEVAKSGLWSMEFLLDEDESIARIASHFISDIHSVSIHHLINAKHALEHFFDREDYAIYLSDREDLLSNMELRRLIEKHKNVALLFQWSPTYYKEVLSHFTEDRPMQEVLFHRLLDEIASNGLTEQMVIEGSYHELREPLEAFYQLKHYTRLTPFPYYPITDKEGWKPYIEKHNHWFARHVRKGPYVPLFIQANQSFDLIEKNDCFLFLMEYYLELPEEQFALFKEEIVAYLQENKRLIPDYGELLVKRGLLLEELLEYLHVNKVREALIDIGYRLDVIAEFELNNNDVSTQLLEMWKVDYGVKRQAQYMDYVTNYRNRLSGLGKWYAVTSLIPSRRKFLASQPLNPTTRMQIKTNNHIIESFDKTEVMQWMMILSENAKSDSRNYDFADNLEKEIEKIHFILSL